jgi:hypothetical protein
VQLAIDELTTVASGIRGLGIEYDHDDWVTASVGREEWRARVVPPDAVSESVAEQLVTPEPHGATIVVASQLSAEAKDVFAQTNERSGTFGWSWLDRRGELQLNHATATGVVRFDKGSLSHSAVLPASWSLATPASDGPIRGRAGSCPSWFLRRCTRWM